MLPTKPHQKIGDFLLGKTIGEGTFGKVKQGIHMPSGKKIAVKVLQKHKIQKRDDLTRVHNQLKILYSKVDHPNIIKLLELHESPTNIYIVTEYVQGQQLYQLIVDKERLSPRRCGIYFCQLLDAVQYLHSVGICHRDIKPQNIMVHGESLKLIDFGLSRQFGTEPMLETSCGSPCYAAPEMLRGGRYDCTKTDVWAMGVTLYAMAAGHLPFQHENTDRLYKIIDRGHYSPVSPYNRPQDSPIRSNKSIQPRDSANSSTNKYTLSQQTTLSLMNSLLSKILQTDPDNRIGIEQINQNAWVKQCRSHLDKYRLHYENDEILLQSMSRHFKLGVGQIRAILEKKEIMSMCTYYYLSRRRRCPEGMQQKMTILSDQPCVKQVNEKKMRSKTKSKSKHQDKIDKDMNSPTNFKTRLLCSPQNPKMPHQNPQHKPITKTKAYSTVNPGVSGSSASLIAKQILQQIAKNARDDTVEVRQHSLTKPKSNNTNVRVEVQSPEVHEGPFHLGYTFATWEQLQQYLQQNFTARKHFQSSLNHDYLHDCSSQIQQQQQQPQPQHEGQQHPRAIHSHHYSLQPGRGAEQPGYKWTGKYRLEYRGIVIPVKYISNMRMYYLDVPAYFNV